MWVPIWVKASAIVTLIVGLALVLVGMLNFFRFEQTLRETTEMRLGFIAKDLKGNIQTGLDLRSSVVRYDLAPHYLSGRNEEES